MPDATVNIGGSAAGAIAAVAAAQGAIDGLTGKTVRIGVDVAGGKGISDAAAALDRHAQASNRAAAGARDHASASERASAGARDHASASDRAASSVREHASATGHSSDSARAQSAAFQEAGGALRGHAGASNEAGRSMRSLGGEAGRARQSMESFGYSTAQIDRALSSVGRGSGDASSGMRSLAAEAGRAERSISGLGEGFRRLSPSESAGMNFGIGKALKDIESGGDGSGGSKRGAKAGNGLGSIVGLGVASGVASAVGGVAAKAGSALAGVGGIGGKLGGILTDVGSGLGIVSGKLGTAAGAAGGFAGAMGTIGEKASELGSSVGPANIGQLVGGLTQLTQVGAYAAAGAGIATAAVGALGAASAVTFGGMTAGVAAAGVGMATFAASSLADSKKFSDTFQSMGQKAHLYGQYISEPMGDALVAMGSAAEAAGPTLATPLRNAFNSVAQEVGGHGTANFLAAGSEIVNTAERMAGALTHAPSGQSALGSMLAAIPPMAHSVASAAEMMNAQFAASTPAALDAAVPAFGRLAAAGGGLGAELVRIGGQSIAPLTDDLASMLSHTETAAAGLAPAVTPALGAVTGLANAAIDTFGGMGPGVEDFSAHLAKATPAVQSMLGTIGAAAFAMGNSFVDGVAGASPAVSSLATSLVKNAPQMGQAIGQFATAAAGTAEVASDAFGGAQDFGTWARQGFDTDFGIRRDDQGYISGSSVTDFAKSLSTTPKGAQDAWPLGGGSSANSGFYGGPIESTGQQHAGFTSSNVIGDDGVMREADPFTGQAMSSDTRTRIAANDTAASTATPAQANRLAQSNRSMLRGGGSANPWLGLPTADQQKLMSGAGIDPTDARQVGGGVTGTQGHAPTAGPGSSFRPVSPAIGAGLGLGGPVLQNMTQAMAAPVASGGAATGQALQQHIQKAVNVAAPAAQAGGASMGAAMNTGMAQGSNSTQSVIDTVTIKHSKRIIDIAKDALGIHSPSTEFDWLGRMAWAGFGQGSERASAGTFGQVGAHMGGVLASAQNATHKFGYDYQDGSAPTVSFNPFRMAQPDEDPAKAAADRKASFGTVQAGYKPGSEGWWAAHDNRADDLAKGREQRQRWAIGGETHDERAKRLLDARADNHERALANLGISGHVDPRRNPSSALNNVTPFGKDDPANPARMAGLRSAVNPFAALPGLMNKAGQNSALGLSQGLAVHIPKVQAAGGMLASAGQGGYKKKDKQASPSAAWADMAGNSVAGAVGGFNAGAPAMAAAGMAAAGTMADVVGGYLSDRGLMAGQAYTTNLVTGVASQIKKSDYQALGEPTGLGGSAMLGLAGTGLLKAGSGAQSYKTAGNTPGLVVLPPASGNQTITVNHNIDISGQVEQMVTTITMDMFGRVTDAVSTRA